MKNLLQIVSLVFLLLMFFGSCTKMELKPGADGSIPSLLAATTSMAISDPPFTPIDGDSIERITVLGSQEPNPYLIPNMQQAYKDLGYNPALATVTNLYVRFKPTTDQLAPPAPDAQTPAGYIKVYDTQLSASQNYVDGLPVKKVRIVARRWFKVDRMYTDNSGYFVSNKHYKNKVRILVKFKNDDAQIKNIRGLSLWQMLFAVKKEIGIYSSDKNNVQYIATQYPDYSAKGNIYWTAATVHNSVQDYRSYAPAEGIGLPPQGIKIFISKAGFIGNGGATPMLAKRFDPQNSSIFGQNYFDSDPNIVPRIFVVLQRRLDMIIGYRYPAKGTRDITQLLSDRIKETTYHELTHAAHFEALGVTWYAAFVNAEVAEIEHTFLFDAGYNPYGRGTDANGPQIALGESWAEYIGEYFADKTYGLMSSEDYFSFGGGDCTNNNPISGFSSHLNVLENFDPTSSAHFHWIPVGLYYDMMDIRNENSPVIDQVSGYTNQQFFNAFSSSITSLGSYKTNLLQQNGNNQSTQINSLFTQYGY